MPTHTVAFVEHRGDQLVLDKMTDQGSQSQWVQDDIYNATPQHSGVTSAGVSKGQEAEGQPPEERPPPLPPRRSSEPQYHHYHPAMPYRRDAERVMAYMIPLPQPRGGGRRSVPQRYMLYLPPAPDLLKPAQDAGGVKERKRDRVTRRWQHEVRKAKTFNNGAVVSLSGIYYASVRGAVYVLSLLQRSELTFLSRLPRKTLRELDFVHPGVSDEDDYEDDVSGGGGSGRGGRFEEVMDEFERSRRLARRDFWIATAVLPFATAVDIAIPIFGGFSEVTLVWMVVTGRAWRAARSVVGRLVPAPGDHPGHQQQQQQGSGLGGRSVADGAAAGGHQDEGEGLLGQRTGVGRNPNGVGSFTEHPDEQEGRGTHHNGEKRDKSRKKQERQPVEMGFRASTELTLLTQYVEAACHQRNPEAFPDVGGPQSEAEVLRSIGWAPEEREVENKEDDLAWQVRKTSEDLRAAATKAAKTWDKWCRKYAEDPERALRDEEKEVDSIRSGGS